MNIKNNPILLWREQRNSRNRKITALILFSFFATFIAARLIVYSVMAGILPKYLFFTIRNVHIHHFTYGVFILALLGLYLILKQPSAESNSFKWAIIGYGMGLGLTFDEFGMWVRLEDDYWIRQSYDAIIIISLLLFNLIYYRYLIKALADIFKIIKKSFYYCCAIKKHPK